MVEPAGVQASPRRRRRRSGIVVFALILVVAGSIGLFWSEWRSAARVATLAAGERSVLALDADRVPRDVAGSLVHVAGPARPVGTAEDPLFAVAQGVLRLDRIVEMYQWREHSEGSGDNRTTRYERVWAEGRIVSERFRERAGRRNPPAPPFASARFQPAEVTLGAFGVMPDLVDLLPAEEVLAVARGRELLVGGVALRGDGTAFLSGGTDRPAIGDVRVRFRVVRPGDISVLAGLDGAVLRPWTAPNEGRIAMAVPGVVAADAMLGAAYRANALGSWAARLLGTLVVFLGFVLLLRIVRRRTELDRFGSTRVMPAAGLAAAAWAIVVVALAWAIFRPLASLGLVVAGLACFALLQRVHARRAAAGGGPGTGGDR